MDEWLVQQFTLFGVHFQNWMLLVLVILVLAILSAWMVESQQ
jgi:hypothetical protein